jgi:hypothetical protein
MSRGLGGKSSVSLLNRLLHHINQQCDVECQNKVINFTFYQSNKIQTKNKNKK